MAVYIEIKKIKKELDSVVYSFELLDGRSGKFAINETTGNTELITPLPDDDGSLFARASYKIKKSWEQDRENLPDKTCWAS